MEKRMENYTLPATSAFSYSPNSKYIEMLLYNYEEKNLKIICCQIIKRSRDTKVNIFTSKINECIATALCSRNGNLLKISTYYILQIHMLIMKVYF